MMSVSSTFANRIWNWRISSGSSTDSWKCLRGYGLLKLKMGPPHKQFGEFCARYQE